MMYAKRIFVIIICVCSFQLLSAQTNYISYTIKAGETLSLLAKKYNTSVGDIMRLNGMHTDSRLQIGEKIKIPTKTSITVTKKETTTVATNSTSSVKVSTNTASETTPANSFVHTVAKGETLYGIAKKYKVTVQDLKTWNHLTSDYAKAGSTLLIESKTKTDVAASTKVETPAPAQKQRVETTTEQQPKQDDAKQDVKQDNTPQNNTTIQYQDTATQNNSFATAMAPQVNAQLQAEKDKADAQQSLANNYSGSGFFATQFNDKNKSMQTVSGVSKTFKTASGWSDGKYYILANNIEPGTIVKITADNGNAVYAKVLWSLGDMKDNAGINFRVSNATAAALHEDNASFNVNVSF